MRTNLAAAAAAATLLAAAGTAGVAGAAGASNAGSTTRISIPLADTGFALACGDLRLTATGGTADLVMHQSTDDRGLIHLSGTGTMNHAVLTDEAGRTYMLSGANHFGGVASDPDGDDALVFTSTDDFVVHAPGGGVIGTVKVVEHISPNGHYTDLELGDCTD